VQHLIYNFFPCKCEGKRRNEKIVLKKEQKLKKCKNVPCLVETEITVSVLKRKMYK